MPSKRNLNNLLEPPSAPGGQKKTINFEVGNMAKNTPLKIIESRTREPAEANMSNVAKKLEQHGLTP